MEPMRPKFVEIQADKAVVALGDTPHALAFLRREVGDGLGRATWSIAEVRFRGGPAPDEQEITRNLRAWRPPSQVSVLSVADLRSLSVSEILKARDAREFNAAHARTSAERRRPRAKDDKGPTFRGSREEFAARDRLRAALNYVEAIEGNSSKPTLTVARNMGISESSARNLVAQARKAGYLTPTPRGVSGGQITPEGRALVQELGIRK